MDKNSYFITAGDLRVTFVKERQGLYLGRIRDKKTGRNLLTHTARIFYLTVRSLSDDSYTTVHSGEGWKDISVVKTKSNITFLFSNNSKIPGVNVTIIGIPGDNKITWSTSLSCADEDFSLYECDYMKLTFDVNKDTWFFSPYGSGEIYPSTRESFGSTQNYPSYGVSMQYMAFYDTKRNRGIYYGIHDPAPAYKKLSINKVKGAKTVSLKAIQPLANIKSSTNSQNLEGVVVWELFDGDWYDAALLYRDWVTKEAGWIPEMSDGVRADSPEWLVKAPHWWLVRVKQDESFAQDVLRVSADLGVESAVHLYDWHVIPFDNDYPHYFPIKEATEKGMKTLKEAGIKVMPYINGRLWDTRDRGMEDWQFSSVAKKWCTKNRNQEPFIERYNSKEEDGSKVELAIMCPSSGLWQEKVQEITGKILNDMGAGAVYIDQIAAASPYICEDEGHSHLPGGGTWWCEGYNNLLEHVNMIKPADSAITTECTADPFMKHIQGYLTWLWVKNDQVPAFPAIYSGYVSMFGRLYGSVPAAESEGHRILIAQSLCYGEQMGWLTPELYELLEQKEFYKTCVKTRAKIGEYFYAGRMLRPPVIMDDGPILRTEKSNQALDGLLKHQSVFGALWERTIDGKKVLVVVNAALQEVNCDITVDLPDGEYKLNQSNGETMIIKDKKARVTISPCNVVYAEI